MLVYTIMLNHNPENRDKVKEGVVSVCCFVKCVFHVKIESLPKSTILFSGNERLVHLFRPLSPTDSPNEVISSAVTDIILSRFGTDRSCLSTKTSQLREFGRGACRLVPWSVMIFSAWWLIIMSTPALRTIAATYT